MTLACIILINKSIPLDIHKHNSILNNSYRFFTVFAYTHEKLLSKASTTATHAATHADQTNLKWGSNELPSAFRQLQN